LYFFRLLGLEKQWGASPKKAGPAQPSLEVKEGALTSSILSPAV